MKDRLKNKTFSRKVERRADHQQVHDDTAHLWAVSYSDFLMVLLCFFIIFFSTDQTKKEGILHKIFLDQKGASKDKSGTGQSGDGRAPAAFAQKNLEEVLKDYSLSKTENLEGLLVQFKDDLYDKGSYEISAHQRELLNDFLKKVMPYRDQVSMTFIGHTDGDPVHAGSKKIYKDNFDLSAIRATRALQFAVSQGFPEEQVAAKGNSKNSRATRSLSVLIKPKGELL